MTITIEILYIAKVINEIETDFEGKRSFTYALKYKIAISISAFIFLIMVISLVTSIIKGVLNV